MEPAHKTLTAAVPNGVLKKHHHQPPPQQAVARAATVAVYRECLKNHAASLGGHAVDGCGEFMASPSSNPSDPTSLTCAACGCHRNFHRRLPFQIHNPNPLSSEKQPDHDEEDDEDDEEEDEHQDQAHDDPDEIDDGETGENSSAPHMLLALSAGISTQPQQELQQQNGGGGNQESQHTTPVPRAVPGNIIIGGNSSSRKRFRTKFSPEQKERMQDLSERLGWKMQRREEGLVEERCREIGIGKGVFKVWMHNNKHNFMHIRNQLTTTDSTIPPAAAAGGVVAPSISTLTPAAAAADDSNIGMRINGSAPSGVY